MTHWNHGIILQAFRSFLVWARTGVILEVWLFKWKTQMSLIQVNVPANNNKIPAKKQFMDQITITELPQQPAVEWSDFKFPVIVGVLYSQLSLQKVHQNGKPVWAAAVINMVLAGNPNCHLGRNGQEIDQRMWTSGNSRISLVGLTLMAPEHRWRCWGFTPCFTPEKPARTKTHTK